MVVANMKSISAFLEMYLEYQKNFANSHYSMKDGDITKIF
jgi:hypothetical protein